MFLHDSFHFVVQCLSFFGWLKDGDTVRVAWGNIVTNQAFPVIKQRECSHTYGTTILYFVSTPPDYKL